MSTPRTRPAERYGDIRPQWHSTLARVLVVTLAVLGMAWLTWVSLSSQKPVRWADVGYVVQDETRATATFDVTITEGRTATCVVEALGADYAVVGSRAVKVRRAEGGRTTREQAEVLTEQQAVTAVVDSCSVP